MLLSIYRSVRGGDGTLGITYTHLEKKVVEGGAEILMRTTADSLTPMGAAYALKDGRLRGPEELFSYCLEKRDYAYLNPKYSEGILDDTPL